MFPRISKGNIEYRLMIGRAFNTERQGECVRMTFETVEEFHHFRYEISMDLERNGSSLFFLLRGLSPKKLGMPGTGTAIRSFDFFDMLGKYDIEVHKQNGAKNSCRVHVMPARIAVIGEVSGDELFMDVSVIEDDHVS